MRHQVSGPAAFVGREIVHDEVHLAPSGLRLDDGLQKADEFRTRCDAPRCGPRLRLSAYSARHRATASRVGQYSKPCRSARPGENCRTGSSRFQRLNRRLLVDAEHHGVLRRIEVQADHIGGLRPHGVGRVIGRYRSSRWGCRPARRQARAMMASCTPSLRPSDRVDQWVRPPRRRAADVFTPSTPPRFQGRREHGRLRATMAGGQSRQPVCREALLPQGYRPRTAAGHRRDGGVAAALGEQTTTRARRAPSARPRPDGRSSSIAHGVDQRSGSWASS